MVAFTGRCLVHRAEMMQLHGAWAEALERRRRAGALRVGSRTAGSRRGVVPAGRDPPVARGLRRGRGGVPGGQPARPGATAGLGPAADRSRGHRRRRRGDPAGAWERPRSRQAGGAASRVRGDHARRRRVEARGAGEPSCRRSRPGLREAACSDAMAAHARGAVQLATGDPGPPWSRCAGQSRGRGRSSTRPTRRPAYAS